MQFTTMVGDKIGCARVTAAKLHDVGSITVDEKLVEAAAMDPLERAFDLQETPCG